MGKKGSSMLDPSNTHLVQIRKSRVQPMSYVLQAIVFPLPNVCLVFSIAIPPTSKFWPLLVYC